MKSLLQDTPSQGVTHTQGGTGSTAICKSSFSQSLSQNIWLTYCCPFERAGEGATLGVSENGPEQCKRLPMRLEPPGGSPYAAAPCSFQGWGVGSSAKQTSSSSSATGFGTSAWRLLPGAVLPGEPHRSSPGTPWSRRAGLQITKAVMLCCSVIPCRVDGGGFLGKGSTPGNFSPHAAARSVVCSMPGTGGLHSTPGS
ncbi:ethanolamine kinase 1 [Platysternon megacephalum]|uniref:Ethanolamine kinase 1 n=1 Tax=Platysternon megacephalum TaxID=55544 RepID=A0A4D9EGK2_9SAUR|nr:ethanolamine kinase 1 [Platysternon megacephalum]